MTPVDRKVLFHHLSVVRTARYCTLGGEVDAEVAPGSVHVRSVWYVLHGYRQLADRFIRRFDAIASPERLIVAPEALNRFYLDDEDGLKRHGPESPVGATWMTRHDRESEIEDYVAYLDELDRTLGLGEDVRRVVLGFSQGAATAARWAALGTRRVDRLVLWGGVLPHDLGLDEHRDRLSSLAPIIVCGAEDPALSVERAEAEVARLARHEVEATAITHSGGHVVDADTLARLARLIDD